MFIKEPPKEPKMSAFDMFVLMTCCYVGFQIAVWFVESNPDRRWWYFVSPLTALAVFTWMAYIFITFLPWFCCFLVFLAGYYPEPEEENGMKYIRNSPYKDI